MGIFLQVDYEPASVFDVRSANSQQQSVVVYGNADGTYKAGDKLRMYRGRRPALLTVLDVEPVQLADSDNKSIGVGTVLKVEGLSRDEDSGQVAMAFEIADFGPAEKDQPAWVSLRDVPFDLTARDRVTFFHPTLGLKDLVVSAATQDGSVSRIEFEQTLVSDLKRMAAPTERQQRMAIPLQSRYWNRRSPGFDTWPTGDSGTPPAVCCHLVRFADLSWDLPVVGGRQSGRVWYRVQGNAESTWIGETYPV